MFALVKSQKRHSYVSFISPQDSEELWRIDSSDSRQVIRHLASGSNYDNLVLVLLRTQQYGEESIKTFAVFKCRVIVDAINALSILQLASITDVSDSKAHVT